MSTEKIGWIGLGHMGVPMVSNLIKAGFNVSVYNRSADKVKPLTDKGAKSAASVGDLSRHCDIIFVMVSDDEAVKDIFADIRKEDIKGKLFINMSTVSPDTSRYLSEKCSERSAWFLEAPVSGSVKPATEGTLVILAAGDENAYERAIPCFEKLGKLSLYLGEPGQGAIAKLAINYYLAITIQGIAETILFAESHGLSREVMMLIINESACGSPMSTMKTASIIKNDYPAAFPLKHMAKDIRLAKNQKLDTPLSQPVFETFRQALTDKLGDEDVMAVIKTLSNEP